MIKVGIFFLLLVSVYLTVRAAPLTDQLKGSAKAMSEKEKTDTVKRTVISEGVIVEDIRNSPYSNIFHPEFLISSDQQDGEGTSQESVTEGSK